MTVSPAASAGLPRSAAISAAKPGPAAWPPAAPPTSAGAASRVVRSWISGKTRDLL